MKPSEVIRKALEGFGPNGEKWTKFYTAAPRPILTPADKRRYGVFAAFGNDVELPCHCALGQIVKTLAQNSVDPKTKRHRRNIPSTSEVTPWLRKAVWERFSQHMDGMTNPGDIVDFNDHPSTTFDDIKQVFERAAQIAEGQRK